jgi:hypothetical protein
MAATVRVKNMSGKQPDSAVDFSPGTGGCVGNCRMKFVVAASLQDPSMPAIPANGKQG